MALRLNQYEAVNESINNNFLSGVHCHATGTGKSWIALELILEYNKKNNKSRNLIVWLCEQKSILIEQFNIKTLKEKGYENVFDEFNILNYTEKKPRKWYDEIDSTFSSSDKSTLVVINRSFLVSGKKYEKIESKINLIIHDECHSVSNNTTKLFYDHILNDTNSNTSCIGFSATPNLEIKPYNNLISHYSIYDAFCDDVILNTHIKWVKSDSILKDKDIIKLTKFLIKDLIYKKIIIWCGTIELCNKLASLWSVKFKDFLICIDTSEDNDNFSSYEEFKDRHENAILFCACKHREGSDIKNLDCCIFLDKVENRNPKTFVQCIGRVLRKDETGKKKYGLIVDLKASSCLKICDRVNEYLNSKTNFPWKYTFEYIDINKKSIMINHLELTKETTEKKIKVDPVYTIEDIKNKFIYECPNGKEYIDRLKRELELINNKKLCGYLLRAVEILEITNYIPHVTRGSCGSSLVCYLLGISNVDPLMHDIKFERFLNDYRDNLPDIDLDFPHFLRDEVFLKLELNWPNQVARISNHVYWHEKSALREAIRKIGINKLIPKEEINMFVKKLSKDKRDKVEKYKNELIDTFRHYSLHCGGIVFFHDGVPDDIKLNGNKKTISQIIFDKNDIAKQQNFKIDILSSRGISQLIDICGRDIDFKDCPYDEKTYKILQEGDNIGLTLAESPLMKKALIKIKPKSISDIAKCLAIIRPAAKDARTDENDEESKQHNNIQNLNNLPSYDIDLETKFIYDDDAISILSEKLNVSNDLADKFRRCISKNKWEPEFKEKYDNAISLINDIDRDYIENIISNLRKYSFCKSHSYSYAQLVYKLAYYKAHNKKSFWKATLKNTHSSYRKWVHLYEARLAGVNVNNFILKKNDLSIYAKNRLKKFSDLSKEDQLRRYGYWDMTEKDFFPNCYFYEKEGIFYFGGLIASSRILSYDDNKKIVLSIGVGPGKYIEILTISKAFKVDSIGIKGRAKVKDIKLNLYQAHVSIFY